jgi:hypothetical protein
MQLLNLRRLHEEQAQIRLKQILARRELLASVRDVLKAQILSIRSIADTTCFGAHLQQIELIRKALRNKISHAEQEISRIELLMHSAREQLGAAVRLRQSLENAVASREIELKKQKDVRESQAIEDLYVARKFFS